MQQVDLEQRLKKLLMDRVGVPEKKIKPEASLADDLSLDSLDGVELAMAIEEEFNLQLDDGQMKQLVTVADALALIQRVLLESQAASGPERAPEATGT